MQIIKSNLVRDSWAAYRAAEGANWSSFKHALRSASFAKYKRDNPHVGSLEGRLVHAMVLEPGSESVEYVIAPFDDFRTKAAKEWRDAETRQVVKQAEWDTCSACADAVRTSPLGAALLDGAFTELSVYAEVEHNGKVYKVKGRIDIATSLGILADLKTTDSLNADEFGVEARKLHYLGQAAFYSELAAAAGLAAEGWAWLCVNLKTTDVFGVEADEEALAIGANIWRTALGRWLDAQETGEWPGGAPNDSCVKLVVPGWYAKQYGGSAVEQVEDEDEDALAFFGGE